MSTKDLASFNDESILIRNEDDFLFTKVDGESVVMNTKNGRFLGMNEVSTDIWELLTERINTVTLVEKLLALYEIDHETCDEDTKSLLKSMLVIGLVKLETTS